MDGTDFQALLDKRNGKWRGLQWERPDEGTERWVTCGLALSAVNHSDYTTWELDGWAKNDFEHGDPNDAVDAAMGTAEHAAPQMSEFLRHVMRKRSPLTEYQQWLCSGLATQLNGFGFDLDADDVCIALDQTSAQGVYEAAARIHRREPERVFLKLKDLLAELDIR